MSVASGTIDRARLMFCFGWQPFTGEGGFSERLNPPDVMRLAHLVWRFHLQVGASRKKCGAMGPLSAPAPLREKGGSPGKEGNKRGNPFVAICPCVTLLGRGQGCNG